MSCYGIVASEETLDNGEYHYYHQNEHGDIEYITGKDGEIESAYMYDAFGNITNSQELMDGKKLQILKWQQTQLQENFMTQSQV